MRNIFIVIFIFITQVGAAQLALKPIPKAKEVSLRNPKLKVVNQATLPFWDDFSVTEDSPESIRIWGTDTTTQWNYELSKDVFVNATLAVNPPSFKVATFDGLDVNGAFHAGTDVGLADELVSDTIDLQGRANVVLSFYWQAGGNVEIPEEGDSLRLQFYDPVATPEPWITVWIKDGGDLESNQDSVFTQEAIQVPSQFLTQQFLFRFQSFGDKDGPFDAWHLDWIYLNDNRNVNEAINEGYEDGTFTSNLSSPFSPFSSIPVNQLTADNDYIVNQEVSVSYLKESPGVIFPVDITYNLRLLNNNQLLANDRRGSDIFIQRIDTTLLIGFTEELSASDPFVLSDQDFTPILGLDSVVLESEVFLLDSVPVLLDGNFIDLRVNDTIRTEYLLHNYYAFDDGTAEYAAGTNIDGAQVAVQYWLEEADTLTHIDIYFPNIDPVSGGNLIELRIFKDLNNEPIKTQDVTVINATEIDAFTRYQLSPPILLADTFYIGYEQSINDYIGIGFDASNPEASQYIYENKTGQWEQNVRLQGALMIRPVFADVDSLVLSSKSEEFSFKAYPNPTTGLIQIEGSYHGISLTDFTGKQWVQEGAKQMHDFSNLKAGLYLLTIHRKEGDQTLKIIKK